MQVIVARIRGSIERYYELPEFPDAVDREAFQRWLMDVLPTEQQRHQGDIVEMFRRPWDFPGLNRRE